MASRQEPNRPEEHFNRAMVDRGPRPPRSKIVTRLFSSLARSPPDSTSNGMDRIAMIANLSPAPLVSTITTPDLVAFTPKIMKPPYNQNPECSRFANILVRLAFRSRPAEIENVTRDESTP